jgi:hypothetical protein
MAFSLLASGEDSPPSERDPMAAQPLRIDPDVGIPDLVRRLRDDARRLIGDEVRLAKLETTESLHGAVKGALWLGVAFAVGIVTLVALTVFGVTLVGRLASGHMWIGALSVGVVELALAGLLIKRGVSALAEPSYTMAETRASLRELKNGSAAEALDLRPTS